MTLLFQRLPAALARVCAQRPIHAVTATVLFALLAYHMLLQHYLLGSPAAQLASQPVRFFHDDSRYSQWRHVDSDEVSADHRVYLTPLVFSGPTQNAFSAFSSLDNVIRDDTDASQFYHVSTSPADALPLVFTAADGTEFKFRPGSKIGKYFEFTKFVLIRFKNLLLGAETFDIILMSMGYSAMMFTFAQLFLDMRRLGSNFWLFFGSILSSAFAFLFSLTITGEILKIKVPLVSLSEGLPFLVATIGFRHKVAFTKPVIEALNRQTKLSIPQVIYDIVYSQTALPLIRDQTIISSSFLLCASLTYQLPGLRNFCILSSIILAVDLFFTFTFYTAIISLKAQITKVHKEVEFRQVLEEDGLTYQQAKIIAEASNDSPTSSFTNSSIVYFKIIMVAGFIGVHLFILGTSWLFDDSSNVKLDVYNIDSIKDILAKLDTTSNTLVTLQPVKFYKKVSTLTELEYFVYQFFSMVFQSMTDPLVSKFLMVLMGISVAINIYLLNVARDHFSGQKQLALATQSSSEGSKKTKTKSRTKSNAVAPVLTHAVEPLTEVTEVVATGSSTNANGTITTNVVAAVADNVKVAVEESSAETSSNELDTDTDAEPRPMDELLQIMKSGQVKTCTNEEVVLLATSGKLPLYALEKQLGDKTRAVLVRRHAIASLADSPVLLTEQLPYKNYDYERVFGACCENVIGYLPLPVGIAGPIIIDGVPYHIPVATTEGCLVASTMRGCKAINAGTGVETVLTGDGMTRGPCVSFPTLKRTGEAKIWLDSPEGQQSMKDAFNSTSRFARLQHIKTAMAGNSLYIRFKTTTGDAMGMNMISKGVEHALACMNEQFGFSDMNIISISGNYCIDKKAAAINWIDGRGKSIVASADIPAEVVRNVLKSDVDALVELNISKNLVGSAMAGSIGGFNAHAANLLTAVFLATGQDPAQNVESSNCITLMNKLENGDLRISVSMPSIEVGTIGGGTVLGPQNAMLELLNVKGPHPTEPGANARQLAKVVASAVLAAELSLCSALAAGHLVQSHMQHNRKAPAAAPAATPAIAPVSAADGKEISDEEMKRLAEGAKICIKS